MSAGGTGQEVRDRLSASVLESPVRPFRPLAVLTVTTGALVALSTPAGAAELGYVNTQDGSKAWAAKADVLFVDENGQAARNVAYAENQCDQCRTGVVAWQLVVVEKGVTPNYENLAVALNNGANSSFVFADAYQVAVVVDEAERLTEEGRAELRALNGKLRGLDGPFTAGADAAQLQARLDGLKADLRAVADDLGADSGRRDDDERHEQD